MSTALVVTILSNDRSNPAGKLADAEFHFTGGDLDGLRVVGRQRLMLASC